jgi:hypothetical protein
MEEKTKVDGITEVWIGPRKGEDRGQARGQVLAQGPERAAVLQFVRGIVE